MLGFFENSDNESFMRNIVSPESSLSSGLFDMESCGWWHTKFTPGTLRRLEEGIEGMIRSCILKTMPANEIGKSFDPDLGRPTKELHAICALLLLGEFRNWTVDQTAHAWCFDASVQFALNLGCDRQEICPRTVDSYRKLLRENNMAQDIFENVTTVIVKEFQLSIKKQRLDSTHIFSDMARFGRLKLLMVTVKRFLVQLLKHDARGYESVPEELRKRYQATESRLFGMETKTPANHAEAMKQTGIDIGLLIKLFGETETHAKWDSLGTLQRVFRENFEVKEDGMVVVLPKAVDENGQSSRVMQNPSDQEAEYDGHKGPGYQVQISNSYDTGECAPGIITACLPEGAGEWDGNSLTPVQEQQERMGTTPEEQLADTHYGSQGNVDRSAARGIKLIAPVAGVKAKEKKGNEVVSDTEIDASEEEEKKRKLAQRRKEQESEEWKKTYSKRSGVEGIHSGLEGNRDQALESSRKEGSVDVGISESNGLEYPCSSENCDYASEKGRKSGSESATQGWTEDIVAKNERQEACERFGSARGTNLAAKNTKFGKPEFKALAPASLFAPASCRVCLPSSCVMAMSFASQHYCLSALCGRLSMG